MNIIDHEVELASTEFVFTASGLFSVLMGILLLCNMLRYFKKAHPNDNWLYGLLSFAFVGLGLLFTIGPIHSLKRIDYFPEDLTMVVTFIVIATVFNLCMLFVKTKIKKIYFLVSTALSPFAVSIIYCLMLASKYFDLARATF